MNTPQPGPDEIIVTVPQGRHLCNSREHRQLGRLAEVIVAFGQLGTHWPDALWPDCWGRSYPMCGPRWQTTRQAAQNARPSVLIRDAAEL